MGGKRLAHRSDLLRLLANNLLRDPAQLLVMPVAQLGLSHVYRPLMMRDHHGGKVSIHIAGRLDVHAFHHLIHGSLILSQERNLIHGSRRRGGIRDGHPSESDSQTQRDEEPHSITSYSSVHNDQGRRSVGTDVEERPRGLNLTEVNYDLTAVRLARSGCQVVGGGDQPWW